MSQPIDIERYKKTFSCATAQHRVTINASRYIPGRNGSGGAGKYLHALIRSLQGETRLQLFCTRDNESEFTQYTTTDRVVFENNHEDFEAKAPAELKNAQLYIDPLNGLTPASIPESVYVVTVLHDLQFYASPGTMSDKDIDYRFDHYFDACYRSNEIVTISEQEAKNLEHFSPRSKTHTIHNFAYQADVESQDGTVREQVRQLVQSDGYIFYPAVAWPHKNHFRLLQAFHILRSMPGCGEMKLVLSMPQCVEDGAGPEERLIAQLSELDDIVHFQYLSGAEISLLIEHTSLLAFPSLYEGFGIPIAEALCATSNVIGPDQGCVREFAADRIHYFSDLHDAQAIAHDMRAALTQGVLLDATDERFEELTQHLSFARFRDDWLEHMRSLFLDAHEQRQGRNLYRSRHAAGKVKDIVVVLDCTGRDTSDPRIADAAAAVREALPDTLSAEIALYRDASSLEMPHTRPAGIDRVFLQFSDVPGNPQLTDEWILGTSFGFHSLLTLHPHELDRYQLGKIAVACELLRQTTSCGAIDIADTAPTPVTPGTAETPLHLLNGMLISRRACQRVPQWVQEERDIRAALNIGSLDKRRFLVIDSDMVELISHHQTLTTSILSGVDPDTFELHVGANSRIDAARRGGIRYHPVFSDYVYLREGSERKDALDYYREFAQLATNILLSTHDVVFIHAPTPAILAGTVEYLLSRPESLRPQIAVRFYSDEKNIPAESFRYGPIFDHIDKAGLSRHFAFFTESEGLRQYFGEENAGKNCGAFPVLLNPVALPPAADIKACLDRPPRTSTEKFCFGYFGEARHEKGFHVIPFIISYLVDTLGPDNVSFLIQTGSNQWNNHTAIRLAKQELRRLAVDLDITLIESFESSREYDDAVASVDSVLLPYGPDNYSRRGSGVVLEALTALKPVVVSAGTDISRTFGERGIITPEVQNEMGLAEACLRVARDYSEIRGQAAELLVERRDLFATPSQFVGRVLSSLEHSRLLHVAPARKKILWIANDTKGQGSSAVYLAQLEYLENAGYEVYRAYIPYPALDGTTPDERDFDHYNRGLFYSDGNDFGNFRNGYAWVPSQDTSEATRSLLAHVREEGHSYGAFYNLWTRVRIPDSMQHFLEHHRFDHIVVNYAHHLGFLDRLELNYECPVVIETHDIQARQYALQQRREVDYTDLHDEMQALQRADRIVSISLLEKNLIEELTGISDVTWALPNPSASNDRRAASRLTPTQATPSSCAELLAPYSADNPAVENWLSANQEIDCLIVASDHEANVESVNWFIRNAYGPLCYQHGINLVIAGSVCQSLDRALYTDRILYLGPATSLDAFYDLTKVVVLPVVNGAGVPIKVLDALDRGSCFCLASFAVNSFRPEGFTLPCSSNAYDMAIDLMALIADPAAREKRANIARQFAKEFLSAEVYRRTLDRVFKGTTEEEPASRKSLRSRLQSAISRVATL